MPLNPSQTDVVVPEIFDIQGMPRKIFVPDNLRRNDGQIYGKIFQDIVCLVDNLVDLASQSNIVAVQILISNVNIPQKGMAIEFNHHVPKRVFEDGVLVQAWIIYYSPPIWGSLQFYSIRPLVFDLHSQEAARSPTMGINLNRFHSSSSLDLPEYADLEECLNFINTAQCNSDNASKFKWILTSAILKVIYPLFFATFYVTFYLLKAILTLIDRLKLPKFSRLGLQLQLRLQQLLFWPPQYFKRQESEIKLSPVAQAQYIGFFNTLWLIANDVIIGFALKNIVFDNGDIIISNFQWCFQTYGVKWVLQAQVWLLSWPGGLKLNAELGSFLSSLFEWMVLAWRESVFSIKPHLPIFIEVASFLGIFGATFVISFIEDVVRLISVHLKLMYLISARTYNWSIFIIYSTFNLFRGKKWNPLRHRVDSALYELDQLLMGTIIFTLFMFILPTISVFYAFYGFVFFSNVGERRVISMSWGS